MAEETEEGSLEYLMEDLPEEYKQLVKENRGLKQEVASLQANPPVVNNTTVHTGPRSLSIKRISKENNQIPLTFSEWLNQEKIAKEMNDRYDYYVEDFYKDKDLTIKKALSTLSFL